MTISIIVARDKEDGDAGQVNSTGQVSAPVVKKRRWGSTKKTTDDKTKKANINISTELLKVCQGY